MASVHPGCFHSYSDRLNATWVKCHLVANNPGGIYQGIVRNMKPTDVFFYIPFPKRHTHSDTLTEKLDHVWSCLHTLSKSWENFMFLTILSIRNMSQHKGQFSHLFVTNLPFIFYVGSIREESTEDLEKKLWPLTIDHSGDNEDSISFFHIFLPTVKYDHHQIYLYSKMCRLR